MNEGMRHKQFLIMIVLAGLFAIEGEHKSMHFHFF